MLVHRPPYANVERAGLKLAQCQPVPDWGHQTLMESKFTKSKRLSKEYLRLEESSRIISKFGEWEEYQYDVQMMRKILKELLKLLNEPD